MATVGFKGLRNCLTLYTTGHQTVSARIIRSFFLFLRCTPPILVDVPLVLPLHTVWNELPFAVRESNILSTFKHRLNPLTPTVAIWVRL